MTMLVVVCDDDWEGAVSLILFFGRKKVVILDRPLGKDGDVVKRERKFFLVYIGKFFTTGITQVVQW